MKMLIPVLVVALSACGLTEPDIRMVEVDVTGTVTLEGAPISVGMILHYLGCEFGGTCGYAISSYTVAETRAGTDGTYHLSGLVPEDYCADRTLISIVGGDIVDARSASGCGESVVDFVLYCDSVLPRNVPECV